MSKTSHSFGESSVYRVDKFIVPEDALAEFLLRVRETQTFLRQQPGFIGAVILQQSEGPGKFNVVTFVEWHSEAEVADVRAAVAAFHRERGFEPQELLTRLGITADIGFYRWIGE